MAQPKRRRWRRRRAVVRLEDFSPCSAGSVEGGARGGRAWHVVVLTDACARHLYTTMTRDVAFLLHRAASPVSGSYAHEKGLTRLVLVETYACRHTARARVQRIRAWPVSERRRLIEASNPDWADLSSAWEEETDTARPTTRDAPSAAA